jgi:hypothetical protein
MAVALTTEQRALLRGRMIGVRLLLALTFGGTVYRWCDDLQPISWGGHTWAAGGNIAEASERGLSMGSSAEGLVITVNGAGLATEGDPSGAALLATVDGEAKKNDPVDAHILYWDVATGAPLFALPLFTGRLSGVPLSRQPGGAASLSLEIESDEILLDRAPGRARTDADQRRMWGAGGGGLHRGAMSGAQLGSVVWGQDAPRGSSAGVSSSTGGGPVGNTIRQVLSR